MTGSSTANQCSPTPLERKPLLSLWNLSCHSLRGTLGRFPLGSNKTSSRYRHWQPCSKRNFRFKGPHFEVTCLPMCTIRTRKNIKFITQYHQHMKAKIQYARFAGLNNHHCTLERSSHACIWYSIDHIYNIAYLDVTHTHAYIYVYYIYNIYICAWIESSNIQ